PQHTHDFRTKGDVRNEMTVHDVQVQPSGAGFVHTNRFGGKFSKVGRQQGRCDYHGPSITDTRWRREDRRSNLEETSGNLVGPVSRLSCIGAGFQACADRQDACPTSQAGCLCYKSAVRQAVAGAAAPSPGSSLGGAGLGISGKGVAACAPEGGSTSGVGGGGVNLPVRTISST